MKNLFLTALLLMLFSTPMIAGDSGTYYDSARPGEGMLLQRDGDTMMFFLFTFGAHGCYEYAYPTEGPFIEKDYDCEMQGDRWFYASNEYFVENDELSGFIYMAYGTNWPEGIQTLDNPFIDEVSESFAVGVYIMIRSDQGWRISIQPFGNLLSPDDPLYSRVWNYTTKLFDAAD